MEIQDSTCLLGGWLVGLDCHDLQPCGGHKELGQEVFLSPTSLVYKLHHP